MPSAIMVSETLTSQNRPMGLKGNLGYLAWIDAIPSVDQKKAYLSVYLQASSSISWVRVTGPDSNSMSFSFY